MQLNVITLGHTITDTLNHMITITEYISYASERLLGLVQYGSV
jgi:hypothetical protein